MSPVSITLIYQNLHPWPDRTLPSIISSRFKPFPGGHYSHSLHDPSPDIMFQMLLALSLISYSLFPQSQLSWMTDAAGGPFRALSSSDSSRPGALILIFCPKPRSSEGLSRAAIHDIHSVTVFAKIVLLSLITLSETSNVANEDST